MKILFILLLFISSVAYSDTWPPPTTKSYSSANGTFILRIEPGNDNNNAVAIIYKLDEINKNYNIYNQFYLVNETSPVAACISDKGDIFTFDDWYGMGYNHVIVKYDINGTKLKEWKLNEIFDSDQYEKLISEYKSVSSINWRKYLPYCNGPHLIIPHELNGFICITGEKIDHYK